jgi:type II restriction enzyme
MNLSFKIEVANHYKSPSQIARVLTEHWVNTQAYCPNCGNNSVNRYKSNKKAADFFCPNCREDFELKSKKNSFGQKIVDGDYQAMIDRLHESNPPSFFLLTYDNMDWEVSSFLVIPKHFIVPTMIERRKPLSPGARRADWVGCNILLRDIPQTGKVYLVRNHRIEPKEKVLTEWNKTLFLREEHEASAKGWLIDVMNCIEKIRREEFSLDEVYAFEDTLGKKHPENKHIKAKIRQQLQVLRDRGYLEFMERGRYRLV